MRSCALSGYIKTYNFFSNWATVDFQERPHIIRLIANVLMITKRERYNFISKWRRKLVVLGKYSNDHVQKENWNCCWRTDGRSRPAGFLGLRSAVLTELCWPALKWPGYLEAELCFSFYTSPPWASSAMYIDLRHPWRLPEPAISVWRNNHETAPQRKTWPRIYRWRFQWFGLFLRYRHWITLTRSGGSQTR